MREVEVSRFVRATPAEVERALTPASVVEYEGTFSVRDVTETEDGWEVVAGASGLAVTLAFEPLADGLAYEQRGDDGPFESMETTVTASPEDEGTRVTARSSVDLGLPLSAVTGPVAAWKRRGELERALDRLATDLE